MYILYILNLSLSPTVSNKSNSLNYILTNIGEPKFKAGWLFRMSISVFDIVITLIRRRESNKNIYFEMRLDI